MSLSVSRFVALFGVLGIVVAGCSTDDGRQMQEPVGGTATIGTLAPVQDITDNPWNLTAPWENGAEINIKYTCDGNEISPPLVWGTGPEMTRAYGIVLTPLDEPDRVLWALANIAVATRNLVEATSPEGAVVGVNDSGALGYQAPCPEPGLTQQFDITVFAQEFPIEIAPNSPAKQIRDALQEEALDFVSTQFTYQRR